MRFHRGYHLDTTTYRGHTIYRCSQCSYDTPVKENIEAHIHNHPRIMLDNLDMDIRDWHLYQKTLKEANFGRKIEIGYLTFNSEPEASVCAPMVHAEFLRLRDLGFDPEICWYDNGSQDGTVKLACNRTFGEGTYSILSKRNMGQSVARNAIIQRAKARGAEYILFVDADIAPIPHSTHALIVLMDELSDSVGCVGFHSNNCTPNINDADPYIRHLEPWMFNSITRIAWTQLGLFRGSMFYSTDIRFDESEAFQGAGWGLEDDDLYLQMVESGYESLSTNLFTYFHKHRSSSLRNIPQYREIFKIRKKYVMSKWKNYSDPVIRHQLSLIDAMHPDIV